MEAQIIVSPEPSEQVLSVLKQHLPYSLSTLRRIQFMSLRGGRSPSSQVLSTFDSSSGAPPGRDFSIAQLDFSRCPETEMWIYSSLENPDVPCDATICKQQILNLFSRVRELEKEHPGQRETPRIVLVAAMHKKDS